jgi:glutamyl-tRNA reductase
MRLALIHRPRGANPATQPSTSWRTCLREVQFIDAAAGSLPACEPVLQDADAYALLLEIVCGLRSPLIGETEVQAQFKSFMAALDPAADRWLRRLGERVLADAKSIREQYLQGFGSHSYGRLASRHIVGDRVALIGTGALARQVLHSAPAGVPVDLWGRRLEHVPDCGDRAVRYLLIANADLGAPANESATSMVVAAPIGEHDLNAIARHYPCVSRLIDLRAADQETPIEASVPVVTLSMLLAEGSTMASAGSNASVPAAASAEVRRRARAFACREELRPFGWDDLCA